MATVVFVFVHLPCMRVCWNVGRSVGIHMLRVTCFIASALEFFANLDAHPLGCWYCSAEFRFEDNFGLSIRLC